MKQKIKKVFENAVWWSGVVMVGLIVGISLQVVRAWTEPGAIPPGGNVGAPINAGANTQWKGLGGIGSLALTGVLETLGLKIDSKTDTAGNILPDVTGKFLAAKDASGQVAWAAGGGGGCYVSYKNDATDAACATGFKNRGNVGTWGYCAFDPAHSFGVAFRPPGGQCPGGINGTYPAYVCCQN